ncbi:MAG: CPBP family intramembrane glutamic endopeptidase [Ktedonobacteraceae bacterium]
MSRWVSRSISHCRTACRRWREIGCLYENLIAVVIIVGLIVLWQRQHGETLADLGWRRPTTVTAIIMGIIFGALWVTVTYLRPEPGVGLFTWSWERPIMMVIGVFLAFGEELAMRGFFMEQLRRGGAPTWVQVVACAIVMGSYHGLIGFHYSLEYGISSFVLFGIVAIIFVIGKRSLTPGLISHAMAHFFGDPFADNGHSVWSNPPGGGRVHGGRRTLNPGTWEQYYIET